MASMAPMATVVASMASMASMVVAPMASMAWMDLMALELKSERRGRERNCSGLARTCCTPLFVSSPCVLLLFKCFFGTVLLKSLHPDATPREMDRSRSLRRVVKIGGVRPEGFCKTGGERAEGLLCKIGEERVDGLSDKIVGGKVGAGKIEGRIGEERADGFH